MNLKLFLICTLSSIFLLGCPATNEDEDVNEIPPKDNTEEVDAGSENNNNTVTQTDAGTPSANQPEDAGNSSTQASSVDAGPNNVTETTDAGNAPAVNVADAGAVDICTLPAHGGLCDGYYPRFYFDTNTGQCESFVFGGCGGNANNFESLEDCEAACGATQNSDAGNAVITEDADAGPMASSSWDFVSFGGCGDVYIHGRNEDDTVGIEFTDGLNLNLAEMVHNTGSDTSTTVFDLAVSPDTLTVTEGTHVTYESCNDALDPSINVTTSRTWKPISGTATITLTPDGEPTSWGGYPATAVLVLENVVLSPTDDSTVTMSLENLTITTFVGWLPG